MTKSHKILKCVNSQNLLENAPSSCIVLWHLDFSFHPFILSSPRSLNLLFTHLICILLNYAPTDALLLPPLLLLQLLLPDIKYIKLSLQSIRGQKALLSSVWFGFRSLQENLKVPLLILLFLLKFGSSAVLGLWRRPPPFVSASGLAG